MERIHTFLKPQFTVFTLLIGFFLLSSCEKKIHVSNKIPTELSDVRVENIAGGAIINFQLPTGEDIVSITTIYEGNSDKQEVLNFNALESENTIRLTNLNSTHKRPVHLYTVNSSGNASEGIEVWIEPLLSEEAVYIRAVLQTLTATALIGGTQVTLQNEDEETLTIHAIFQDGEDEWIEFENRESSLMNPTLTFEGLAKENLGFYISDVLNNYSDTLFIQLTPIVEHELDKSLWTNGQLPTDTWVGNAGHNLVNLWDYKHGTAYVKNGITYDATTVSYRSRIGSGVGEAKGFPQHFTINLGDDQNLKLSRIRIHQYMHPSSDTQAFHSASNSPKVFEVWGSNSPDPDGSWTGWEKIITGTRIKPSENLEVYGPYARKGEDFYFPSDTKAYQYIRFNVLEKYGPTPATADVWLHELTLWGIE